MTTPWHLVLGLLAACSPLFAQTVWSMGAPWPDLDQVIALAVPGDIVQLNGMQFPPFTMSKGLTLIGTGTILPSTTFPVNHVTRLAIPAGEQAHVVDVAFAPHPVLGVSLAGNATTFHGRTTLVGGGGGTAGAPSSGPVQHVPQCVGMSIGAQFRLGMTTNLTAISGSSQPLGMFASFDASPSTHPAVIGPIFGQLGQLVPLFQMTPTAGQQVPHSIGVPNQPHLLGVALQIQAYQLDGNFIRMSAGVAGVVH